MATRHPGLDDLSAQRTIIESRDLKLMTVRGPGQSRRRRLGFRDDR
jgi:hypothetical protein